MSLLPISTVYLISTDDPYPLYRSHAPYARYHAPISDECQRYEGVLRTPDGIPSEGER